MSRGTIPVRRAGLQFIRRTSRVVAGRSLQGRCFPTFHSIDSPKRTQEPAMTKTFAAQATPVVLAALLTAAMLFATNALASHQYRVAAAAQESTQNVALNA
jgi:hypothetical protein